MNKLSIRLAAESDLDTLCDLYFEFHAYHAHHLPTYLRTLDDASTEGKEDLRNKIKEIIQGSDSAILVADCSGRVIGLVEIYLRHPDPANLAVVPKRYAHLQSHVCQHGFQTAGNWQSTPSSCGVLGSHS